jgi:hypothetical protein
MAVDVLLKGYPMDRPCFSLLTTFILSFLRALLLPPDILFALQSSFIFHQTDLNSFVSFGLTYIKVDLEKENAFLCIFKGAPLAILTLSIT